MCHSIASFALPSGPLRSLNLEIPKSKLLKKALSYASLKLLPLTRISLILTSTKFWRWPCIFLYCFLRFSLKTRTFSPRPWLRTEPTTLAPVRFDSNLPSSPLTARTSENSTTPFSWAVVSILSFSPGETRYCVAPIAFLHELCCMGRIQEHCIKPTGQTIAVFFADRRAQACRPCNP